MAVAPLTRRFAPVVSFIRSCSTSSVISVGVNGSGVARVSMDRRPANAVDLEFFRQLRQTFVELERKQVAGVVLASSLPKIFSAGLDITKMAAMKGEEVKAFAESYYDCWQTLYEFPLPTAAAITGHAPAVGCLLAMVCERRVMVDGCGHIGLNEAAFGLPPDRLLVANFKAVLPLRAAEAALLSGRLFTPAEALEVGLVDELAANREDAFAKCESFIKTFSKIPAAGRGSAKKEFRQDVMRTFACPSRQEFVDMMIGSLDLIHTVFGEYTKKLKGNKR